MICSRALVLSSILAASVAALPLGCGETTIVDTPWDGAIPSGFAPLPIRSGALVAFVTNSFSDTISVVDLETRSVVAQRPVGRSAVDVDGPISTEDDVQPRHESFELVLGQRHVLLLLRRRR